eukprot:6175036-Pleurochrysis_carterae.AAC.2
MSSAEDPTQESRCTRRRALSRMMTIPHRRRRHCAKTPLAAPACANPVALQWRSAISRDTA